MPSSDVDPCELLTRHGDRIRRLVRRLVATHEAADVEQEIYIAALERPPRHALAMPTWIATTIRNILAKRWRGSARREAREHAAAVPEPTPSTHELVARVELEEFLLRCVRELAEPAREVVLLRFFEGLSAASIAGRLNIGESTVRARLARALARLRERLDAKSGGDRKVWIAALGPPIVVGSSVVTFSAAAVVLAAATLLIVSQRSRRDGSVETGAGAPIRVQTSAVAEPSHAPAGPLAEAERAADPSMPAPPTSNAPAVALAAGRLRFLVVDAATLQPLDRVTARAQSETRFAVKLGSGPLDVGLSAGTYDVAFSGPGFETQLRRAIAITVGDITDLGTIVLSRGTGSIRGRVHSDRLATDARRYVELRGDGRSPCPRCGRAAARDDAHDHADAADSSGSSTGSSFEDATRALRRHFESRVVESPCCGYFAERSFLRVDSAGRFRFDGLAAGVYFVRALDALPRAQATLRVEIAAGEQRSVELSLEPEVALRIDLRDEAAHPFVGRWKNDWSEEPATIHFTVDVDGVALAIDAQPDTNELRAALGPPPRLGEPPDPAQLIAENGLGQAFPPFLPGLPSFQPDAPADRPRTQLDSLFPPPPVPVFASVEFGIVAPAPATFVLTRLPASRVRVSATCGRLASTIVEVDLADPNQRATSLTFIMK